MLLCSCFGEGTFVRLTLLSRKIASSVGEKSSNLAIFREFNAAISRLNVSHIGPEHVLVISLKCTVLFRGLIISSRDALQRRGSWGQCVKFKWHNLIIDRRQFQCCNWQASKNEDFSVVLPIAHEPISTRQQPRDEKRTTDKRHLQSLNSRSLILPTQLPTLPQQYKQCIIPTTTP